MKKRVVILFGALFVASLLVGQDRTRQRIDAGDDFFENSQYSEAIEIYKRVFSRDDSRTIKQEVAFKIGNSYRKLLNYNKAKTWYSTSMNLGYDNPEIYLYISEVTLGLEEFDTAIDFAERFLEYEPENERGVKMLESAKYSKEHYYTKTIFEVSFEESLSSDAEEWGIAYLENYIIFHDDPEKFDKQFDIELSLYRNNIMYWARRSETPKERIVFSSTRPTEVGTSVQTGYSNIYQSMYSRQEDKWDPPTLLKGGINSPYYEGFLSYDKNNRVGYFMNCGGFDGTRETCDIYTSEYDPQTDTWGQAKLFDYNSDNYNIGYPSINDDGTVLYFASDNPEGHGEYDLYKIFKNDNGKWSKPENLGSTINTEFNDAYPYIAGNVLYFSSFGNPGMGGFDVFYSIIDEDGNYSEPQNMGAPINSSADDFGFVINEDYSRGFFSSNRPGGSGNDDIYSFNVISKDITLKGLVTDGVTNKPIKNFEFFIIGEDGSFYTVKTDNNGKYELPDINSSVNYEVEAYHQDYDSFNEKISVEDQLILSQFEVVTEYDYNIELFPEGYVFEDEEYKKDIIEEDYEFEYLEEEPVEEDLPVFVDKETYDKKPTRPTLDIKDFDLPLIHFDFAKHDLKPYAKQQLDSVVEFLKNNKRKGVVIHGHTDIIAGHLINFFLSQKRAHNVKDYLVKNGIDSNRLYAIGHGKMEVAIPNAQTDEEHRFNRRVNFEPKDINRFNAFISNAPKHSFRYLNSITKDVFFASGIEFMVQFAATQKPINPNYYNKIMEEFPEFNIIYYYDKDQFHRYLVGSFDNFNIAYETLRKLRTLGYDTYIVAFDNGERISVSLAQSLTE